MCNAYDLTVYSGFVVSAASPSGAITAIGIGVDLADKSKGQKKISVGTSPADVTITWSDLGINDASRVTDIFGYFVNGASAATSDLTLNKFGLK